jgi:hypothetical protein
VAAGGSFSVALPPPLAASAADAFSLSEIHVMIHTLEGCNIKGRRCIRISSNFFFIKIHKGLGVRLLLVTF